ncbi:hypothetical protein GCM10009817_40410 [Terrabacter lapilli]|uniref:Uncharacterized protein n=1 Tax=Terrabacter lapilli TaxID=436231 RepID=A0ABP5E9L2_9MICO
MCGTLRSTCSPTQPDTPSVSWSDPAGREGVAPGIWMRERQQSESTRTRGSGAQRRCPRPFEGRAELLRIREAGCSEEVGHPAHGVRVGLVESQPQNRSLALLPSSGGRADTCRLAIGRHTFQQDDRSAVDQRQAWSDHVTP